MQLDEFANSLERQGMKSKRRVKSWSDAFFALENGLERLPPGKKVVFLDELPWMDTAKSNFVPALDHFWNGLSFELVCLEHIEQIKRSLGISGIQTEEHAWRRKGNTEREGAQIDLLIKRADHAVNICEMKYSVGEYEISEAEGKRLKHRRQAYIEDEKFKGSVFLTMVTPHGLIQNAQWNDIQSEVTLDDLFKE